MLGHGAGIGYTGHGPRMGPTDNFSLVTGPMTRDVRTRLRTHLHAFCTSADGTLCVTVDVNDRTLTHRRQLHITRVLNVDF